MTRTLITACAWALLALAPQAQTGLGQLVVACPEPGALWIDGEAKGPCGPSDVQPDGSVSAPGPVYMLPAGEHEVTLVDDATGWNPRRATETVTVAGATVVELVLPTRTRVETLPLGAEIVVVLPSGERHAIGPGPADIDLPVGTSARVVATLDDHLSAEAALPADGPVTLILPPAGQPDADPVTLLPMRGSTRTRTLIDLGIGAAAVAAGALAVHYKFRADDLDDLYRDDASPRRGDESLRDDILRYDALSNTALAGMQVGLGVLAVRFILR